MEEVITIDDASCNLSIAEEIDDINLFESDDSGLTTFVARALLEYGLIVRVSNWQRYFDAQVGPNVELLKNTLSAVSLQHLSICANISLKLIRQFVRAEFRLMYFLHGKSYKYNYELVQYMLLRGNEWDSMEGGMIRVRPLVDPDTFVNCTLSNVPVTLWLL